MDILYTVEEKYLQAVEELNYGELPKALHLFHEIVNAEPAYARAYYQLGSIYHYHFKNFQSAGYYYKKCIEDHTYVQPYIAEGFGEDFVPANYDMTVIDHFEQVADKEGALMTRRLAKEEGLFVF